MVHDPHRQTLTAVARVSHPAYVLLSPDDQARRVHGWGRALAGLAASGICARVQVLESSLPDSGHGITGWWAEHGSPDSSQWAVQQYDELMATMAPAASTHRTLIALSLDLRKSARAIRASGRGIAAAASVLGQEMANFEASLRAAELKLDAWLDPGQLAGVLRGAYDPAATAQLEASGVGHDLATAGPVAVEEHWDHLRHDTGYSAVLWVSEWPRIDVPPHFLHALVFAPGVRKTISITATPLSTGSAMRDIRKAKVEYVTDAAQKSRMGVIADLCDAQELEDVLDRERALVSGHADLRFTGLVTITAATKAELDESVSQLQTRSHPLRLRDPTPVRPTGPRLQRRRPTTRAEGRLSHGPDQNTYASTFFTSPTAADGSAVRSAKPPVDVPRHAHKAARDDRRSAAAALRAERQASGYLPRNGESGPAALRSYSPLRLPPHRATSDVLAGAYPFLAEGGLGSEGTFIGQDAWSGGGFCFDPWVLYEKGVLTNPNCLLAGVVGRGKSMLAKSIATRSIAFGRKVYVPGDPKGEWSVVAKAVGGASIQLGGGSPNRLNPLDEGPRPSDIDDTTWAAVVNNRRRILLGSLVESALARPMTAVEHTALDLALRAAVAGSGVPTLPKVVDALFEPAGRRHRRKRRPAARRRPRHRPRPAPAGLRRPRRPLRRRVHRRLRPIAADDHPRPLEDRRLPPADRHGDDLRLGLDGSRTLRPPSREALGDLRRGLATPARTRSPGAHAGPVEALPRSRHRQPDDHPPAVRPRRRRQRQLGVASARARPARRLLDQDHLPAGDLRGTAHRRRTRPLRHRTQRAARPSARRRALARRTTRLRRSPPRHRRRAGALRHERKDARLRPDHVSPHLVAPALRGPRPLLARHSGSPE